MTAENARLFPRFFLGSPISSYSRKEPSVQYPNREQLLQLRWVINKSFLKKCLNKLISLWKWEETMGKAPELLASREINIAGFMQLMEFSFHHHLVTALPPQILIYKKRSPFMKFQDQRQARRTHIYEDTYLNNEYIKHYVLCQNGYWNWHGVVNLFLKILSLNKFYIISVGR